MKRDMDLVRNLLLATERADCAIDAMGLCDDYSNDVLEQWHSDW